MQAQDHAVHEEGWSRHGLLHVSRAGVQIAFDLCLNLSHQTDIKRAPECFNDGLGRITLKSDIFSLGVVLWELVTREKPYEALSEFQVATEIPLLKRSVSILPFQSTGDFQSLNAKLEARHPKGPRRLPAGAVSPDQILLGGGSQPPPLGPRGAGQPGRYPG